MISFNTFLSRKSRLAIVVIALITICTIDVVTAVPNVKEGSSTYADIDNSQAEDPKAAAEKVCGDNLSAEELSRRRELADTAVIGFWNKNILEAMKSNNDPLTQALNCQKIRVKILRDVCELQANKKLGRTCETNNAAWLLENDLTFVPKHCNGVDKKLFIKADDIKNPDPSRQSGKCTPQEFFTTPFSKIDTSKIPGQPLKNAVKICDPTLSPGELKHRSRMGEMAEELFLDPEIIKANYNEPLLNTLNCQKYRIKTMTATCLIVRANISKAPAFEVEENTIKQQRNIANADKFCAKGDEKLYFTVRDFCYRDWSLKPCASKY